MATQDLHWNKPVNIPTWRGWAYVAPSLTDELLTVDTARQGVLCFFNIVDSVS